MHRARAHARCAPARRPRARRPVGPIRWLLMYLARLLPRALAIGDTRIDERVHHVHDQVQYGDHERVQQSRTHDQRVITLADALHEQSADTWDRKDRLY